MKFIVDLYNITPPLHIFVTRVFDKHIWGLIAKYVYLCIYSVFITLSAYLLIDIDIDFGPKNLVSVW